MIRRESTAVPYGQDQHHPCIQPPQLVWSLLALTLKGLILRAEHEPHSVIVSLRPPARILRLKSLGTATWLISTPGPMVYRTQTFPKMSSLESQVYNSAPLHLLLLLFTHPLHHSAPSHLAPLTIHHQHQDERSIQRLHSSHSLMPGRGDYIWLPTEHWSQRLLPRHLRGLLGYSALARSQMADLDIHDRHDSWLFH